MKILLVAAAMAALLALACGWPPLAGEPEPTLAPADRKLPAPASAPADPPPTVDWAEVERMVRGLIQDAAPASPAPAATPRPTPLPTATPLPEGAGICYRTPEVQDWIIQRLQIPSCRVITEPELYRIKAPRISGDDFVVDPSFTLKPGDLSGLVNIDSIRIAHNPCVDWENPDYAAAVLDGLNPDATISVQGPPVAFDRDQIISFGLYGTVTYPAAVRAQFDDGLVESGLTDDQIESLLKQGEGLKMRVNTRARNIAATIAEAIGKERPVIRLVALGHAVTGELDDRGNQPEGSISVRVELLRPVDIPDCPGQ